MRSTVTEMTDLLLCCHLTQLDGLWLLSLSRVLHLIYVDEFSVQRGILCRLLTRSS
jgi:hypothetical protein